MKKTVTVGLVVYNAEKTLLKCLNSLLAQTYQDIIIILSDDCSTDNTEQICRECLAKSNKIRYYRHQENCGMINNFNFVLDKSSSKYFMWACGDDEWRPEYIEECVKKMDEDEKIDFVSTEAIIKSGCGFIRDKRTNLSPIFNEVGVNRGMLFLRYPLLTYKDNIQFSVWVRTRLIELRDIIISIVGHPVMISGALLFFPIRLLNGRIIEEPLLIKNYDKIPPHSRIVKSFLILFNFINPLDSFSYQKEKSRFFDIVNREKSFQMVLSHLIKNKEEANKVLRTLRKTHNLR